MNSTESIDWSQYPLGKTSDINIAKMIGCTSDAVYRARKRMGIKSCPPKKLSFSDQPLGILSDQEIATMVGCYPGTVANARRAAGIAAPPRINWSKQPLGKVDDDDLAKELGVTATTVARQRAARGIPKLKRHHSRPKPPRKKKWRRSVSLRPQLYCRLKDFAEATGEPMTQILERALVRILDEEKAPTEPTYEEAIKAIKGNKSEYVSAYSASGIFTF